MKKRYILYTLSAIITTGIGYVLIKKNNNKKEDNIQEQEEYASWEEEPVKRKYINLKFNSNEKNEKKCS